MKVEAETPPQPKRLPSGRCSLVPHRRALVSYALRQMGGREVPCSTRGQAQRVVAGVAECTHEAASTSAVVRRKGASFGAVDRATLALLALTAEA